MKILVGILTLAILVGGLVTLAIATVTLFVVSVPEDSLLWNCYLMGNHQCGNADQVVGFILGGKD